MEPKVTQNVLSFGAFEADLSTGELRKNGILVHLQEQPFQVLKVLLEHPRELISREQLRAAVWPQNTFVDFDHALNTAVKKIRHALDDDALSLSSFKRSRVAGTGSSLKFRHTRAKSLPRPHLDRLMLRTVGQWR